MKLNTGRVAFPIEFDNGEKEFIYFNPNDPDFPVRLKGFVEKVQAKLKKLDEIKLKEDGTPEAASYMEQFAQAKKAVADELDYTFGSNVSDVVFKFCSPFALIDGKYFIAQFIEAITPEIVGYLEVANADKINKHIGKYKD